MPNDRDQVTLTLSVYELSVLNDALEERNDAARHGQLHHYDGEDHEALGTLTVKVTEECRRHHVIY